MHYNMSIILHKVNTLYIIMSYPLHANVLCTTIHQLSYTGKHFVYNNTSVIVRRLTLCAIQYVSYPTQVNTLYITMSYPLHLNVLCIAIHQLSYSCTRLCITIYHQPFTIMHLQYVVNIEIGDVTYQGNVI